MRICVTGGAGYIGSHACVELLESGHEVMVIDSLVNGSKEAIKRIQDITGKNLFFLNTCLTNISSFEEDIRKFNPQSVIHFAGLKAVHESVEKPLHYYFNNVCGTINLLKVMTNLNIKKIVFSSSATVYGTPSYLPYDENHPLNPVNPYGKSKLMIENILEDWSKSNVKHKVISLRYFNPIGAHHSGKIGEDPKDVPRNLMPYITQVAVGKRRFLEIFGNDYDTRDGTCERDYVDVVQLSGAHVNAIDNIDSIKGFECINIGSGKGITVLELVNSFIKATGIDIKIKYSNRRDGDLPSFYSKCHKAKTILGWEHSESPQKMCISHWNWQRNNPDGYNN